MCTTSSYMIVADLFSKAPEEFRPLSVYSKSGYYATPRSRLYGG